MIKRILEELKNSSFSVLPIFCLVVLLELCGVLNLDSLIFLYFIIATILVIIGITFFNLGASIAMTPIGKYSGSSLTKQGKLWILLIVIFLFGFLITIAEPDLTVLANQTKTIFDSTTLIIGIAIGVAIFLVFALLRLIFKFDLSKMLCLFYLVAFALTTFICLEGKESILGLAFDSGGVTTGPMTVPFLMSLGVGVASIISQKKDKDASFGFVALSSIGPIIVVLILSLISKNDLDFNLDSYLFADSFINTFLINLLNKSKDVLIALALISVVFLLCNFLFIKLSIKKLLKLGLGLLFTFVGLTLFLASVETVYIPVGNQIGHDLSSLPNYLIILIGFFLGAVTVLAEPAVRVLVNQVEEITNGLISRMKMFVALVIGVGIAIALAFIRIIFDFSILYYLIPGYIICFILSFLVPKIYVAVAFDSGGVCSGPLTSSFILPLAIGLTSVLSIGGNNAILENAFGVVSLVALSPIITIEIVGAYSLLRNRILTHNAVDVVLKEDDKTIINFREEE